MTRSGEAATLEPGSFRDRDSRVVLAGDAVYRLLSESGERDWSALKDSGLLEKLVAEGRVVETEEADLALVPQEVRDALPGGASKLLRHQRVPFVSYPYEWTFSMLQDAALLQLDLQLAAIDEGLTLKDATPYNVQFRGGMPTFIDLGSFEPLQPGEPWVGYRQFCMLYLYPLLFQAYKDIPFHPWLRGSIDGIPPATAASVFSLRDRFRRGVFMHAVMHARLERRSQAREGGDVKQELKKANFKPEMIKANLRSLRKLVAGLRWKTGETAWTGYRQDNTYSDEDAARKQAFVSAAAAEIRPGLSWDMGCNDGAYARLAAEHTSDQVVAFDFDHATVEALYRSLREEGNTAILPLVGNLSDPSPGLGWRGSERRRLEERGRPDLVLALALIHHVSITANVPIAEFLGWLRDLGGAVVIEFPHRDDPMVKRLLSGKAADANADYDHENFVRELKSRFRVEREEQLPSGTRTLYLARPSA